MLCIVVRDIWSPWLSPPPASLSCLAGVILPSEMVLVLGGRGGFLLALIILLKTSQRREATHGPVTRVVRTPGSRVDRDPGLCQDHTVGGL